MKKFTLVIVLTFITQAILLSQPCLPSGITLTNQADIDNFSTNHPNCTEIGGDLIIEGTSINNLNGLSAITLIDGTLEVMSCDILSSLTGLNNVTYIDEDLNIVGNEALFSLLGLEGLTEIGGDFNVRANQFMVNFSGLNNLTTISGAVWIYFNSNLSSFIGLESLTSIDDGISIGVYGFPSGTWGNPSLTTLAGLSNLTSVSGDLIILGNQQLTSLSGLDNIAPATIGNLTIADNSTLTKCEVESICSYLVSPTGSVTINSNATGCGSPTEVAFACGITDISDFNSESELSIYPNPAETILFISSKDEIILKEVSIYNQLGQKVLQENQSVNKVDISMLQQGSYIVILTSNELIIRKKLIVK